MAAETLIYGNWGRSAEAERDLAKLEESEPHVPVNALLDVYISLGRKDQAIALLRRAYAERSNLITKLKDPAKDRLRSDPRFQHLLRRAGFD